MPFNLNLKDNSLTQQLRHYSNCKLIIEKKPQQTYTYFYKKREMHVNCYPNKKLSINQTIMTLNF